jgi:hypothetical protein
LLEEFTDDRLVDELDEVMLDDLEDENLLEEIAEEKLLNDVDEDDKLTDVTDDWLDTRLEALTVEDELIESPALDIEVELCATEEIALAMLDTRLLAGDEPLTGSVGVLPSLPLSAPQAVRASKLAQKINRKEDFMALPSPLLQVSIHPC